MISQKPAGMPNRQKIIIGVLAVAVVIVLWQVIGMFSGGKTAAPTPSPVSSNRTSGARTPSAPSVAVAQPAAPTAGSMQAAPAEPHIVVAAVPRDSELLRMQQEVQQKYIDSLNELQMLRIKKEIAEANQAIATAKLAEVTAEKSVSDLLTQPAPPPITAASVGAPGDQNNPSGGLPIQVTPPTQYAVISVAMKNERWTAVISSQGKLYSVSVGDILPDDNSVVTQIGRDGVILEKNGDKRKISMISEI